MTVGSRGRSRSLHRHGWGRPVSNAEPPAPPATVPREEHEAVLAELADARDRLARIAAIAKGG